MSRIKNGDRLICVPCGREVTVSSCGISDATLFCCDRPMKKKGKGGSSKK